MSYKEIMGFDDRRLLLIGIPIVSLIVFFLLFGDQYQLSQYKEIPSCFFASILYTSVFWFVFRWIIFQCIKTWPYSDQTKMRIIFQFFIILLVYTLIKVVMHFTLDPYIHQFSELLQPSVFREISVSLTMVFLIITIYEAIRFYSLAQIAETDKARLAKENLQSQLDGLKSQVNPHFLFNSLNTLSHLIPEDKVRAEAFIQKLANVYRYILKMNQEQLIQLSEELTFLESYIFLLKERFSSNLNISIEISEEHFNKSIVPLSLQILVENAIKHNTISVSKPLHIKVAVNDKNQLFVENNLQPKREVKESTKIGLQNIKNQYDIISNQTIEIIKTTHSFIVYLPLLVVGRAE